MVKLPLRVRKLKFTEWIALGQLIIAFIKLFI